jgi:hypothetical protein
MRETKKEQNMIGVRHEIVGEKILQMLQKGWTTQNRKPDGVLDRQK